MKLASKALAAVTAVGLLSLAACAPSAPTAEDIDQQSIERMIGLDYSLFLSTVVRGQFAESFLELTPKKKMDFLSTALELDHWQVAADKSSALRKECKERVRNAANQRAARSGTLAALTDTAGLAREAYAAAVVEDERQAEAVSVRREAVSSALRTAREDYESLLNKVEEYKISFAEAEAREGSIRVAIDQNLEDLGLIDKEHAEIMAKHSISQKALSASQRLEGECPTCHSQISEECRDEAQRRAEEDLLAAQENLDSVDKAREILRDMVGRMKKQGLALASAVRQESGRLQEAEMDLVRLEASYSNLQEKLDSLTSPVNPQTSKLKAHLDVMEAQRLAADRDHQEACDEEAAAMDSLEQAEFWVRGFQDIRLWMLRSALDELEALANSHTLTLGLRGWRILFEVERETKSGGTAKGFRCFIQSPTNTEPVALESWSGGELQRLKLATQAAMCDLIRSRFGGAMALEVWDEPGQHLSARGCADMMAFFRERAATLGIEIWIVDHRSTASGDFDQQLVVTRTRSGTSVKRGLR